MFKLYMKQILTVIKQIKYVYFTVQPTTYFNDISVWQVVPFTVTSHQVGVTCIGQTVSTIIL